MGKDAGRGRAADSEEIRFVAGATRTMTPGDSRRSPTRRSSRCAENYEALLANPQVDAVVLATPHSLHARAGDRGGGGRQARLLREAVRADEGRARSRRSQATQKAGVTLGLGYNRRFHPEMTKLREQIRSGELGTILHVEATMTFPNALLLKPDAWRAEPRRDAVRRR